MAVTTIHIRSFLNAIIHSFPYAQATDIRNLSLENPSFGNIIEKLVGQ
jgi:hypothetical protein